MTAAGRFLILLLALVGHAGSFRDAKDIGSLETFAGTCPRISSDLRGDPQKGNKATYITWSVALQNTIEECKRLYSQELCADIPENIRPENVVDVGGKNQAEFDSIKNKIESGCERWSQRLDVCRQNMTKILKVDVPGFDPNRQVGLLTGGSSAKREEQAATYNILCKCKNFFPLKPSKETLYTMQAAVSAWANVWRANFGQESICPIVVVMAGSTDLHVGVVSDRVVETMTIIDYKEEICTKQQTSSKVCRECYKGNEPCECQEIIPYINGKIQEMKMVVIGGSSEFSIHNYKMNEIKAGNAFVFLTSEILEQSKLPHKQVQGLDFGGNDEDRKSVV